MRSDSEKGIKGYVDADFIGGWNQEEVKDPVLVLCITGSIITYDNCPIIWMMRLQTEI